MTLSSTSTKLSATNTRNSLDKSFIENEFSKPSTSTQSTAEYLIQSVNKSNLHQLSPPLSNIRLWLLHRVLTGNKTVANFQRLCGVKLAQSTEQKSVITPKHEKNHQIKQINQQNNSHNKNNSNIHSIDEEDKIHYHTSSIQHYTITNPILHVYFSFAAAMGNEMFYILFLPLLFWLIDCSLARRVILMWFFTYYTGQYLKDLLQLPRPSSPLVAKLETHYETEYGFPSTHAMIALTLPASILYYTQSLYNFSLVTGLIFAFIWTFSIACSRLYNGVHSLADVIGGLILGLLIIVPVLVYQDIFDHWVISSSTRFTTVTTILSIAVILLSIYPRPKRWTICYGDTTIIIGVASGVFIGYGCNENVQHFQSLMDQISIHNETFKFLYYAVLRTIIGSLCMITTRAVFKFLTMLILPPILLSSNKTEPNIRPDRIYLTEIPSKFVTYTAIGLAASWFVPQLFQIIGI